MWFRAYLRCKVCYVTPLATERARLPYLHRRLSARRLFHSNGLPPLCPRSPAQQPDLNFDVNEPCLI